MFLVFICLFFLSCPFSWNIGVSSRSVRKTVVADWSVYCDYCPSWAGCFVLRRAELLWPGLWVWVSPISVSVSEVPGGASLHGLLAISPNWPDASSWLLLLTLQTRLCPLWGAQVERGTLHISATAPPCFVTLIGCAHADL